MYPSIFNRFPVIQPVSSKVRHFSTFFANFGLPRVRPWDNRGKCYMMERGFNAGQMPHSMYPSIFNLLRAIARYWSEIATFSFLSANQSNPAHKTVFNYNFKTSFDRKPNQIPSLGFRTSSDLEKIDFKKKTVSLSTVCSTPPWLLARPTHSSDKGNTPLDIYKSRFYELCDQFSDYYRIFTDGSKVADKYGG